MSVLTPMLSEVPKCISLLNRLGCQGVNIKVSLGEIESFLLVEGVDPAKHLSFIFMFFTA